MLKIDSNLRIDIFNGDSGNFSVSKSNNGSAETFVDGDTVYFSVKKTVNDAVYAVHKVVTTFDENGKAVISLVPADTKDLPAGDYVWDIQLTDGDGQVSTLMSDFKLGRFIVHKAVTSE